ncbi:MAG: BON domain-containing protein [Acidobacteria bacterium]|nr:BON domain-containing protein [Acidobacteriota bacterium]
MTTAVPTQPDVQLRDAVVQQLDWDSQVDASAIGVTVKGGVVTLTGFVGTYAGKLAAERAVKRVRGVRAVANDVQVRLRLDRTDADIAADAVRALDLRGTLPENIQVTVHNGHVTLTGTVNMLFQRAVAEKALRHIRGIKGIVNRIQVTPAATARGVRQAIVQALHRDADVDARGIEVTVSGNKVTITGAVSAWHEKESAERAAMHAPGITVVDNRIVVAGPEMFYEGEIC